MLSEIRGCPFVCVRVHDCDSCWQVDGLQGFHTVSVKWSLSKKVFLLRSSCGLADGVYTLRTLVSPKQFDIVIDLSDFLTC